MATLVDNILLIKDLDNEAKTRSENADNIATAAYIVALNDSATSAELMEILKQDYALCGDLARASAETVMLAKHRILDNAHAPAAATTPAPKEASP